MPGVWLRHWRMEFMKHWRAGEGKGGEGMGWEERGREERGREERGREGRGGEGRGGEERGGKGGEEAEATPLTHACIPQQCPSCCGNEKCHYDLTRN